MAITRDEWNAYTPDQQWELMLLTEAASDRYSEVIRLIPPCPQHGDMCLPHAADWIKEMATADVSPQGEIVGETAPTNIVPEHIAAALKDLFEQGNIIVNSTTTVIRLQPEGMDFETALREVCQARGIEIPEEVIQQLVEENAAPKRKVEYPPARPLPDGWEYT
jgi:hypothetical protein